MADMDSKRGSFKTVCHKYLLTINNESVCFFFQSKMGQTKHKPLRKRDFLGCLYRNYDLYLEHILKINTKNRILLCKSNNQIKKSKKQCT